MDEIPDKSAVTDLDDGSVLGTIKEKASKICGGLKLPENPFDPFQMHVLLIVNKYRLFHQNAGAVTLSSALCNEAKEKADELLKSAANELRQNDVMSESFALQVKAANPAQGIQVYGKNCVLFKSNVTSVSEDISDNSHMDKLFENWFYEKEHYDYTTGKSTNNKPVSHFTQIVWNDVKSIGTSYASLNDVVVVVIVYDACENAATRTKHVFGENVIGKIASTKRLAEKKFAEAKAAAAKVQKVAGQAAEKIDQVTDLIP